MVIVKAESRLGWQLTTREHPSPPAPNNISGICIQTELLAPYVVFVLICL